MPSLFRAIVVLVNVQRKPRNCFGQDSHTRVLRRPLHSGRFVDRFPARRAAEEETVAAAVEGVSWLIAGAKQVPEWIYEFSVFDYVSLF